MGAMGVFRIFVIAFFIGNSVADISLESNSFKVYRQVQTTTQKIHIRLRFKTIHATGLIMFSQGANKKDFMTIELYRGKIRVAGNFGDGPKNRLRPIGGFFSMNLGKDLADNEWHTVQFIANIREMLLFIDRGTINEKKSFMQSPPTYHELAVAMVTFGGYYSFAPSEMSADKSLARKGIQACFSEARYSQTYPTLLDTDWIDFIYGDNGENMMTIGTIAPECLPMDPPYIPLFFPSSAVHIALVENYTIDSLKVELMFRTVISDQTLANYTTKLTGERIQFRLDRKGRISLSIDVLSDTLIIETSKEKFHDGEWHSVSFEIDNKLVENSYLAKFSADGKTRLSSLSNLFNFNGYVNIGFGFTGCMREIKINDDEINKVRRDLKLPDEFFSIVDVGVVPNSCSLKDYCNPNPCQHGGKCNQTEDNIVCDCLDTLYEGSTCHRARFNYTCAGVRKSGERRSDVYFIDFDGMGPMEPVRALCDLGRTVETTTTQINNTKYLDIDVSSDDGRNALPINYAASITQMRELIMNSAFCQQFIKFTCRGSPIFRSPEGPPATWWMGGDDINHYYWGGAKNHRGYCECGVSNTCRNNKKYCNCDDLAHLMFVHDEGNFTIKEHLPVREVVFTSVLKDKYIQSILRVGHLRCSGFGSRLVSATFRKPWSFLSVYHPDQPFDNINAGGISFDFKTSMAYNYMVIAHARGPFSGDYIKIMIWSRTMLRIHFNAGFGDLKQDVDISSTGRTLDDNQWHEFNLMFNMKELNVTLDGVRMIQGLPLQEDPFEFTVDSKPVYVGGSYHDPYGFVGCIRSLYVNGRIFDLRNIATGQEDFGVYPGCGAACMILNRPCNYGFCIDEYDSFKCNCSVSPNDGKYCQNETYPRKFTGGQFISYDMVTANKSEPIGEAIFVVGFKTTEENAALAQLVGTKGRHFTLALIGGYLTLFFTMKDKEKKKIGDIIDTETEKLVIDSVKLNTKTHFIVRVRFSTEEVYLSIPTLDLEIGANVTERYIDETNLNKGVEIDVFEKPITFTIGNFDTLGNTISSGVPLPTSFSGCMSGAKLVYNPRATAAKHFRKSFEVDMFSLIQGSGQKSSTGANQNPTGTFPSSTERCGPEYPSPGELPTVGPARQFFTKSPGLDDSVRVPEENILDRIVIVFVALFVAIVLVLFLFILYRLTNRNHKKYNKMKEREKPLIVRPMVSSAAVKSREEPVYPPDEQMAASKRSTPASHRAVPGKSNLKDPLLESEKEEFL